MADKNKKDEQHDPTGLGAVMKELRESRKTIEGILPPRLDIMDAIRPPDLGFHSVEALKNIKLPRPTVDFLEGSAKRSFQTLVDFIRQFETQLNPDEEIGAILTSFGNTMTFNIREVAYRAPDIITFYGVTPDGQRLQLVQHVSQLSVLFTAMPKLDENAEARRIGFDLKPEQKE